MANSADAPTPLRFNTGKLLLLMTLLSVSFAVLGPQVRKLEDDAGQKLAYAFMGALIVATGSLASAVFARRSGRSRVLFTLQKVGVKDYRIRILGAGFGLCLVSWWMGGMLRNDRSPAGFLFTGAMFASYAWWMLHPVLDPRFGTVQFREDGISLDGKRAQSVEAYHFRWLNCNESGAELWIGQKALRNPRSLESRAARRIAVVRVPHDEDRETLLQHLNQQQAVFAETVEA